MHSMWEYGNTAIHNRRGVMSLQMHGILFLFISYLIEKESKKPKHDDLIHSPPKVEYRTSDWETIVALLNSCHLIGAFQGDVGRNIYTRVTALLWDSTGQNPEQVLQLMKYR